MENLELLYNLVERLKKAEALRDVEDLKALEQWLTGQGPKLLKAVTQELKTAQVLPEGSRKMELKVDNSSVQEYKHVHLYTLPEGITSIIVAPTDTVMDVYNRVATTLGMPHYAFTLWLRSKLAYSDAMQAIPLGYRLENMPSTLVKDAPAELWIEPMYVTLDVYDYDARSALMEYHINYTTTYADLLHELTKVTTNLPSRIAGLRLDAIASKAFKDDLYSKGARMVDVNF
ncbi:Hypothetical protein POVN_LOCUS164 [uncultured virus]|nr:Hypothetical protein POVN_LOCUS164 [uncultured virus]